MSFEVSKMAIKIFTVLFVFAIIYVIILLALVGFRPNICKKYGCGKIDHYRTVLFSFVIMV